MFVYVCTPAEGMEIASELKKNKQILIRDEESIMTIAPIYDDRKDPAHKIRSDIDRRKIKTPFHLLKVPFIDSEAILVTADRRSGFDRRSDQITAR